MTKNNQLMVYQRGCYCQAIDFQGTVDEHKAIDCNCEICRQKGYL